MPSLHLALYCSEITPLFCVLCHHDLACSIPGYEAFWTQQPKLLCLITLISIFLQIVGLCFWKCSLNLNICGSLPACPVCERNQNLWFLSGLNAAPRALSVMSARPTSCAQTCTVRYSDSELLYHSFVSVASAIIVCFWNTAEIGCFARTVHAASSTYPRNLIKKLTVRMKALKVIWQRKKNPPRLICHRISTLSNGF